MRIAEKIAKDQVMYSGDTLDTEVCAERQHWWDRGLAAAVLDVIILRLGLSPCIPPVPECLWDFKRKLTFDGNVSATDLDDFPVMVHLDNTNFDFNKAQANGEDIRFMDSDTCPTDGTPLKHEIEDWDKPGANAWVWVKVPRIDGGSIIDFIYMFYGNGAAPDGQDAVNVWTSGYDGVWHMKGDAGVNVPDSLGVNAGTKLGVGQPANITENIDGSQHFDGNNDRIGCGNHASLDYTTEDITFSFWINGDSFPGAGSSREPMPIERYGLQLGGYFVQLDLNVNVRPSMRTYQIGANQNTASSLRIAAGTWYYLTFVRSGADIKIYRNGIEGGYDVKGVHINPVTRTTIFNLGYNSWWNANFLDGKLDEVRAAAVARTPDWVMGQYKSQADTLITFGPEE